MRPRLHHVWENSYPPAISWELPRRVGRVDHLLRDTARRYGEQVAVDYFGCTLTYGELEQQVRHFASGLQELGVRKGDRVGLCLPNTPYFIVSYYAILRAGAVVVNMNPLLTPDELADVVRDSGTKVVVTVNVAKIYEKLERLNLPALIVADMAAALPWAKALAYRIWTCMEAPKPVWSERVVPFDHVLASTKPLQRVHVNTASIALLQYTGGTTGTPKAAALTHGNLLANTEQIRRWMGAAQAERERFLVVLPLFHVFAMTVGMNLPVATGALMVLLPRFVLKEFMRTLARVGATVLPGVPSLFGVISSAKGAKTMLGSLRWCICGGAPLPAEVRKQFESVSGSVLVEGYGLTEASPVVCCNMAVPLAGSVGLPLPGTDVQIRHIEKADRVLKTGETGEIWVCGPQIMAGYWGKLSETRKVLQKGWLRTGDVGHMDEKGFVYVTDRLKNIIISNGYNVYARVIEDAVYAHPAVAEVTVIAIPHPYKGEVAKVFVSLKPDTDATAEEILAFARGRLNPTQRPAELEVRETLPKTAAGKLSKKELVAEEQRKRK